MRESERERMCERESVSERECERESVRECLKNNS